MLAVLLGRLELLVVPQGLAPGVRLEFLLAMFPSAAAGQRRDGLWHVVQQTLSVAVVSGQALTWSGSWHGWRASWAAWAAWSCACHCAWRQPCDGGCSLVCLQACMRVGDLA